MAKAKKVNNYMDREFPMSPKNYSAIQDIAYELTGIKLSIQKQDMVYSRLARRLRQLRLGNFDHYCQILESREAGEQSEFINAITTNLTSFFREEHHFDFLKSTVFPQLKQTHRKDRRIRAWSAGCSTGEEPYSISIMMRECLGDAGGWNAKLLATDLDSNVVAHGKRGIYAEDRIDTVSETRRKRWFKKDPANRQVMVKPELQKAITFKRLNLLEPWPIKGPFDFIFCRNVVIYFDKDTQRQLFDRYADILAPNGFLFIGHSESLHRVSTRFKSLGKTIYQKVE